MVGVLYSGDFRAIVYISAEEKAVGSFLFCYATCFDTCNCSRPRLVRNGFRHQERRPAPSMDAVTKTMTMEYLSASSRWKRRWVQNATAEGPIPSPMRVRINRYTAEAWPRMFGGIICCIAAGATPNGAAASTQAGTSQTVAQPPEGARSMRKWIGTQIIPIHIPTMILALASPRVRR